MWLIVRIVHDRNHYSVQTFDPRATMYFKNEERYYIRIIKLSELGVRQTLDTLKLLYIGGMFNKTNEFMEGK